MKALITERELMEATGYNRRAPLEKCLRKNKVQFHYGRGGQIWTTADALNISLGISSASPATQDEEWTFV